jgi:hypothetical protein
MEEICVRINPELLLFFFAPSFLHFLGRKSENPSNPVSKGKSIITVHYGSYCIINWIDSLLYITAVTFKKRRQPKTRNEEEESDEEMELEDDDDESDESDDSESDEVTIVATSHQTISKRRSSPTRPSLAIEPRQQARSPTDEELNPTASSKETVPDFSDLNDDVINKFIEEMQQEDVKDLGKLSNEQLRKEILMLLNDPQWWGMLV